MTKELDKSPAAFNDIQDLRNYCLDLKEGYREKEDQLEDLCNTVLYYLSHIPEGVVDERKTIMLYRLVLKLKGG